MKLIKTLIFLFLLTFTTFAFGKSNEYFQATVVHVLTQCDGDCQRLVFREEVDVAFYELMKAILGQLNYELSLKQKERYE